MTNQRGFTLIEVLVAGAVSLVIPAALIIILTASNRQMGDGASRMRLSQIATAVSEDIHRAGLTATWAYGKSQPGVSDTTCPNPQNFPPDDGPDPVGFAFCDENFKVLKAFRVQNAAGNRAVLAAYDTANGWKPMVFAGDTVKLSLDPSTYADGQPLREGGLFGISPNGVWAWINFHFQMEISGKPFSLPMQMQSVVCRNAPSRMAMNPW